MHNVLYITTESKTETIGEDTSKGKHAIENYAKGDSNKERG